MNIRATHFVLNLRGMSPTQKAVAFAMAGHADKQTAECNMSMDTLAAEAGLKWRDTAARIASQMVEAGILDMPYGLSKGGQAKTGRGKTTVYRFTFTVNCNSGIAVEPNQLRLQLRL